MIRLHQKPYYVWLGRQLKLTKRQISHVFGFSMPFVEHYWSSTPPKDARSFLMEEFNHLGIRGVLEGAAKEKLLEKVVLGLYRPTTLRDFERELVLECMRVNDIFDDRISLKGVGFKVLEKLNDV
ncbi:hypothetical protein ACIL2V_002759 [Vibrio alginolyticus]